MKIKTITCHDVYNFGASLQAYALMSYLRDLGHDVEIIDYKPDYLTYNIWDIGPRWNKNFLIKTVFYIYVVPKRLTLKKSRNRFDKFTKERLKLTGIKYHSIENLENSVPDADVYFAGSDQIWNTYSENGKDPSFFLTFAPENSIKASYAASFSTSVINPDYKEQVKSWLNGLDYVSVREKTGVKILEDIGIYNSKVVVDPVFLYDSNKWLELASSAYSNEEKYIFVYDQENNKNIKQMALKLAEKHNLKIIACESLYPMTFANKRVKDAGPEEFLGLIQNAEICLTNSFHCVAFSLIFNKDFLLFPRTHQKVNSRMIDLLSSLGLSDKIIENISDDFTFSKIDYTKINIILKDWIEGSKSFIDEVLLSREKDSND